MKRMSINGVAVYYESIDGDEAAEIGGIAADASRFISEYWSLAPPRCYRVYVMASLIRFRLHSAPWPYWLILVPILPIWYFFGMKLWPKMSGLTEDWERRPAIGIKPRRLMQSLDSSCGKIFMIEEPDLSKKLRHITAHELMHAFTAQLKPPLWLNEGIAVLSSERYLGKAIVKSETITLLAKEGQGKRPEPYDRITDLDAHALAYQYARGYWITRYLDTNYPLFLRDLLKKRRTHSSIETAVSELLAIKPRRLWYDIDAIVADHFAPTYGEK